MNVSILSMKLKCALTSWALANNHGVGVLAGLASLGKSTPGTPWVLASLGLTLSSSVGMVAGVLCDTTKKTSDTTKAVSTLDRVANL